jgi:hypothetical protein
MRLTLATVVCACRCKREENDGCQLPDERKNTADFCGFQRCPWMPVDGKLEGEGKPKDRKKWAIMGLSEKVIPD